MLQHKQTTDTWGKNHLHLGFVLEEKLHSKILENIFLLLFTKALICINIAVVVLFQSTVTCDVVD